MESWKAIHQEYHAYIPMAEPKHFMSILTHWNASVEWNRHDSDVWEGEDRHELATQLTLQRRNIPSHHEGKTNV